MKLHVDLKENGYDIYMEKGILYRLNDHIQLNRKVMIITDTGVPNSYAQTVKEQCKEGYVHVVEAGESSKSMEVFQQLCEDLLEHNFSRKDCVIALGGGVVGDTRQHYHFVCSECNQVYDMELGAMEDLNKEAQEHAPGIIDSHYVLFYGRCNSCLQKKVDKAIDKPA